MNQLTDGSAKSLATPEQPEEEITSFAVIRTETVLSKFPVHNLSKKGKIAIAISNKGPDGIAQIAWEVSYNDKYGPPGQIAYKLDTLLINRKLEEAGRPLPKYLRLGSLREIAKILGVNTKTAAIKTALLQNASAFITAKFAYTGYDGTKQNLEAGFTRYSVVFTGETLPDGSKADAVYIILNDIYREVLDQAQVRPLNYDYLQALTPAAQRFYEILSYRIFAAFQQKSPHAAITYSEYCTLAPQIRSRDWNCVRAQMYKVHKPHLDSKYLARVEFRPQPDENGQPDWLMLYTAGPKAKSEYARFTRRRPDTTDLSPAQPAKALSPPKNVTPKPTPAPPKPAASRQAAVTPASRSRRRSTAVAVPESSAHLLEALTARGISARGAAQLLAGLQPGQAAQLPAQLEYADYLIATATNAIQNPAGFLVSCVRDNLTVPHDFATTEQQAREAAAAALREAAAEERMKLEFAYADYQREGVTAYLAALPAAQRQHLYETEEAAFLQQYPEAAHRWAPGALPQTLAALRENRLAATLPLLGLEAFAEQLWPSRRAAWETAWAAAQEAGRAGRAAR